MVVLIFTLVHIFGGLGQEPLYGMPVFDDDLEQAMAEGRIALGGCCLSSDDPAWLCTHCQLRIFRAKQDSSGIG